MAVIFHPNIRYLMTQKGIVQGLAASVGITVYSGTQPSAATISASWSTYNSANSSYLVHYSGAAITQSTIIATLTTTPAATLPTNSGTATWGIIWSINPSGAQLSSVTIPSTSFIVVPVSDGGGTGIIRLASTTVLTGTAMQLLDVSIATSAF